MPDLQIRPFPGRIQPDILLLAGFESFGFGLTHLQSEMDANK
jgi:hypothetical protein